MIFMKHARLQMTILRRQVTLSQLKRLTQLSIQNMKSPNLNREQLNDLKELLTERMVDNMSTKDLAEYVADDLFNYFDKLGEHEFLDEAKNYWDDMFPDIVQELIEDTTP